MARSVGDVRFVNFTTADNIKAGVEFFYTFNYAKEIAYVKDSIFVGNSGVNSEKSLDGASPYGIITPSNEGFLIDGASFYKYNFTKSAALGDCYHCKYSD